MNTLIKAGTSLAVFGCVLAATFSSNSALADDGHVSTPGTSGINALDHAPIGVMGDHRHAEGEWMISYRLMHMNMGGAQIGTEAITPEQITTTVPNRFFGAPGQPPTLRIVPTSMRMDMHMAGVMYGLTDQVTLMVMANYVTKEMDHTTFQGGAGTTPLGEFRTDPAGFGDTKIAALIGLTNSVHINAGLSLPTGSNSETDDILTPMGGNPNVRLPYPMQLGSGTFDLEPGITYRDQSDVVGWGAQLRGTIRLGRNNEGYSYGDRAMATAWMATSITPGFAISGRIQAETLGRVDGMDPMIVGPVQTANPDFQGGESVTGLIGANFAATEGSLKGWRIGIEGGVPIVQNLKGPQMPTDYTFTVGVQKSF